VVPAGALLIFLNPLVPLQITLTAAILVLIVVVLVIRDPDTTNEKQLKISK
jgi:hypothetical protein